MSQNVTLASARTVIEAARKRAEQIGVPMCIAVVDGGANLVAFARMDGAWLGSIDIAQDKAFTRGPSISRPRSWRNRASPASRSSGSPPAMRVGW